MNRFEVGYSWEDRVNYLVNNIIIKLYRENNSNNSSSE